MRIKQIELEFLQLFLKIIIFKLSFYHYYYQLNYHYVKFEKLSFIVYLKIK